jgi:imidazole glycerol-phosphate synthase subunit HisH
MRDRSPHGEAAAEHQGTAVIALLDYGAGNLASVRKALSVLGAEVVTPQSPGDLHPSHGIIVPGVGHFGATKALCGDWTDAIRLSLERGAALLGICLGMQWLFEGSAEAPLVAGLGVLTGHCDRIHGDGAKVPHVGWNSLQIEQPSTLLAGVANESQVYFTHSYVAPLTRATAATTGYGGSTFTSAVEDGRISGVQFHPEKSGDVGLRILRNWLDAV